MHRQQRTVTCSKCGVKGHNKKSGPQVEPKRPMEPQPTEQSQRIL